jgi:2-polyprenyl-6-hydroxyphenyl methylase / 3-demethylubiquinone-9 3-methyltransferase
MNSPNQIAPDTNIDPAEVDQFDRQATLWWDASGPFRLLHKIGPLRLTYIREATLRQFNLDANAAKPYAGLTFLDVGCGGGLISEPLRRLGGQVTGIDPAAKNIGTAQAHARMSGLEIDYRNIRAEDLAAEGRAFDTVVCLEVIEHVPDPAVFVATLSSLVKPGGLLVLSTLSRTAKSFALAIVGAEYVLRWLPRGTHDWNRFITPQELERYASAAGLTGFSAQGMVYDPLRDTWQLSHDTAVNYLAHCTKPSP